MYTYIYIYMCIYIYIYIYSSTRSAVLRSVEVRCVDKKFAAPLCRIIY